MPIDNGIGHSDCTAGKQEGLAAILRQHIAIVKRVFDNNKWYPQTYYYFDLYAGSGSNPEEGCDGSPVIFLKTAKDQLDFWAAFIEQEEGNAIYLRAATAFINSHVIYEGDNKEILPGLLNGIPKHSYGLIYADPNGLANFNLLSQAAKTRRKLDILIHYPAASAKRNNRDLLEYLKIVGKSVWLIREPEGKHQWTFLFGTNYSEYKAWRSYGFYRWDEPKGMDILETLTHTKTEIQNMHEVVFQRANNICEKCHVAIATEINHLSYKPPCDIPENMIAVCHRCHCEIHGKEN